MRMCQENLSEFKDGTRRLAKVVTGNEAWFYYHKLAKIQSNKSWVTEGVKMGHFAAKNVFSILFKK